MTIEPAPIELVTDHRCLLGAMTDRLGREVSRGLAGRSLADLARTELAALLREGKFERCCLPAYLALAPRHFEREIQLPIGCSESAELDTRVLLWPVGARDGEHPHCEGWAAFVAVKGPLTADETRHGERMPERPLVLARPELLFPEHDVSHHIHNVGDEVGLSVHVFGSFSGR